MAISWGDPDFNETETMMLFIVATLFAALPIVRVGYNEQ